MKRTKQDRALLAIYTAIKGIRPKYRAGVFRAARNLCVVRGIIRPAN